VIAASLLFPILVRYDARRPASWLMLAAGAVASWALGRGGPADDLLISRLATTVFAAGLLAVGSVGELPRNTFRAVGIGPRLSLVWAFERVAWPISGWWLGTLAAMLMGQAPPMPAATAGLATLAAVAASLTIAMLVNKGGRAADAASAALAAAAVVAAVGLVAGRPADARGFIVSAVAGWGALAAVGFGLERPAEALRTTRPLLNAAAMVAALGGMVGWLFLDPAAAGHAVTLCLGSFVSLAVPEATLGDGVSSRPGWRRLYRSALDLRRLGWLAPLGRYGDAVTATAGTAAILGWPPLVALLLSGAGSEAGRAAMLAVAGLAAAAAALVALVAWRESLQSSNPVRHSSTETTLAIAVTMTLGIILAQAAAGLPISPFLPQ